MRKPLILHSMLLVPRRLAILHIFQHGARVRIQRHVLRQPHQIQRPLLDGVAFFPQGECLLDMMFNLLGIPTVHVGITLASQPIAALGLSKPIMRGFVARGAERFDAL